MFNPIYGLWQNYDRGIQPSPNSVLIPDYLMHFEYAGKFVAKAFFDNYNIGVEFTTSFIKHILKAPIYMDDIDSIDQTLFKNLLWYVNNKVD